MKKILGWIILILGIGAIIWGLWTSIDIFTGQRATYEVFKYTPIENNSLQKGNTEENIENIIREQISNMFPPEVLFKFFNLVAWGIFMMILITAGGKLANIGIGLIKEKE
jgi:uncharacterized membrane protein YiaA